MDDRWLEGPDGVRRCWSAYTRVEIHSDRMELVVPRRGTTSGATFSVRGTGLKAARHLLQVAVLNGVRLDACKIIARLAEQLHAEAVRGGA